jgi:uncharacterized membrane protein YcaP (DUF421 family)
MGKRQLGELEISEFISALLLSELATIPIADERISLLRTLVPLVVILVTEIFVTYVVVKNRNIKKIINGTPTVLMSQGKLELENLRKSRITIDELISELRILEIPDISLADYIILELNGKISVFTSSDNASYSGIAHNLIIDGYINHSELIRLKISEKKLLCELQKKKVLIKDILILSVNDQNNFSIMLRGICKCQSISLNIK